MNKAREEELKFALAIAVIRRKRRRERRGLDSSVAAGDPDAVGVFLSNHFLNPNPSTSNGGAPSGLQQALGRALAAASLGQSWEWVIDVVDGSGLGAKEPGVFFERVVSVLSNRAAPLQSRAAAAVLSLASRVAERFPHVAAASIPDCVAAVRRVPGERAYHLLSLLNCLADSHSQKQRQQQQQQQQQQPGHRHTLTSLRCLAEDCEWAPTKFPPLTRAMVGAAMERALSPPR